MQAAGPGLGSFVLGQQQAQKQQLQDQALVKGLADLYSSQQTYSQNEQKFPLTLEKLNLENKGLGLTNQGLEQDNRLKTSNADVAIGTLAGKIASTNSKSELAIMQDDVEKAATVRSQLQQVLANAQALGPAGAAQAIQQLQSSNNPMLQQYGARLAQVASTGKGNPLALLQKGLDAVTTHLNQQSLAFQQALAVAKEHTRGTLGAAEITGKAHIESAREGTTRALALLQQKQEFASNVENQLAKEGDPKKRAGLLEQAATKATADGNEDLAQAYRLRAAQAYAQAKELTPGVAANANRPDLNALGVPTLGQPGQPASAPRPQQQLSQQDQQALDWAMKNRNDPRAQAILNLHGAK